MLGPILEQIGEKYADKVQVVKVDVDDPANQPLAMQYRISSIPRVIFFIGGNVVEDFVGVQSAEAISALVENHLGKLSAQAPIASDESSSEAEQPNATSGSW